MTVHMRPSQIEFWPLERPRPYTRNAKTHDADQEKAAKPARRTRKRA